jgi:transposase-like protein
MQPNYLATRTISKPTDSKDLWATVSEKVHSPDCTGMVTVEENAFERVQRWKCSKCSVRGAKAI